MKEKPISFRTPMVQAILNGRKTQTRRIVKPQPEVNDNGNLAGEWLSRPLGGLLLPKVSDIAQHCPYGPPGTRLWVQETWAMVQRGSPATDEDLPARKDGQILIYRADDEWNGAHPFLCADGVVRWAKPDRWLPAIFMPRNSSRVTLEVTGVRVEKLLDISEADAIAEGLAAKSKDGGRTIKYGIQDRDGLPGNDDIGWNWKDWEADPRQAYRRLWEQIYGLGSWDANPWVWVIDFRRLEGEAV